MSGQVPVVDRVDALIFGGSSAAVCAALGLAGRNLRVLLAAPRAYLGEDIASQYLFWEGKEGEEGPVHPLAAAIYGDGREPPTPMQVKMVLERAMVDQDVRFLLNCCSAEAAFDREGRLCGAVLVNRAGRQLVLAHQVIDATLEGTFSRSCGVEMMRWSGRQTVEHVTLCQGAGRDAEGLAVEPLAGFHGEIEGKAYELSARRYRLEVDLGDGSPDALCRAYAEVVDRCRVPEQYLVQEQLRLACPAGPEKAGSGAGDMICFEVGLDSGGRPEARRSTLEVGRGGLWVLSPSVADGAESAVVLRDPQAAMLLADRGAQRLEVAAGQDHADAGSVVLGAAGSEPVAEGVLCGLAEPLRPGRRVEEMASWPGAAIPRLGRYDVVVVGGGTGGAPASIAAAEAGMSTAVIEAGPALGGVGTLGQIAKYWFGNRVGFTAQIDQGVKAMEFRDCFRQAKGGWSVAAKTAYLHRRCVEAGVSIWFRSFCVGVWMKGDRVCGILVAGPYGYGLLEAGVVIDSTGSADVPAAAGAPTVEITDEHVAVQGTGLAGLQPGRDYHNSDHNFSDDSDVLDATAFLVGSRRKFRNYFDLGQLIDSRERRQIVGELTLDPVDFLYQRRFPDTVCVASSNFDSHGFTIHPVFMIKPPNKEQLWVDVPYRCLLPKGLDGVLVTGLGVSAHRDALPVIRMQPDVQNQGYAAGYAAAMAVKAGVSVRDIDVRSLQRHLVAIGSLPERVLTDEDSFPIADEVLDEAIAERWDDYSGLALIFADPGRSIPRLVKALDATVSEEQRVRYALILALMGDDRGASVLEQAAGEAPWDEGWDYRGMGQFGMTLSAVDVLLVGLGRVGDASAWPVLLEKADALVTRAAESGNLPEFSHCRAIALAFESLTLRHADGRAGDALAALLELPGVSGHAQTSLQQVIDAVTPDTNENQVRNHALRELYLGRALFRCDGGACRGRAILEAYADDLRGHFARHAARVLASQDRWQTGGTLSSAMVTA